MGLLWIFIENAYIKYLKQWQAWVAALDIIDFPIPFTFFLCFFFLKSNTYAVLTFQDKMSTNKKKL